MDLLHISSDVKKRARMIPFRRRAETASVSSRSSMTLPGAAWENRLMRFCHRAKKFELCHRAIGRRCASSLSEIRFCRSLDLPPAGMQSPWF